VAKFFTQWFPAVRRIRKDAGVQASAPVSGVALRYDNLEADVFATLPVVVIPDAGFGPKQHSPQRAQEITE